MRTQADTIEAIVKQERVAALYRGNYFGLALTLLLAPLVAWRAAQYADSRQFGIWLIVSISVVLLRAALSVAYFRSPPEARAEMHWATWFVAGSVCAGLCWGVLALPLMEMQSTLRVIVFTLLMVIAAVIAFSHLSYPLSYFGMVTPIFISLLFCSATRMVPLPNEMMVMTLLAGLVTVLGVLRLSHNFGELIRARVRSGQLMQAATAAYQAKSQFIANMSHEIRTPINGMMGMAEALCDAKLPPPNDHYARTIVDVGQTLLAVVNDVLDFSKIDSGKLLIEAAPVDIRRLLGSLARAHGLHAAQKHLKFSVELADEVPAWICIDAVRLAQIVGNLLSNAVKFTQAGSVTLTVGIIQGEHPKLRIEVKDTGIGISPDQQIYIFEAFSQADASTSRRFGGTGLGLCISRQLAELMTGRMGVESVLGEGSHFWVELPLVNCEPVDDSSFSQATMQKRPGRVLVVEDIELNAEVARLHLEHLGLDVCLASSGAEAIERFRAEHFDLILMDCQMSEMDGYETTRRIRVLESNGYRTPIVALTAHALQSDRDACLAAGMDGWLAKPIDRSSFGREINRWLPKPVFNEKI